MGVAFLTDSQLVRGLKYGFLIAIPVLIFFVWRIHSDPLGLSAKELVLHSQVAREMAGVVDSVALKRATYVQAATSIDGTYTPAYNIYRFKVTGSKDTVVVSVRVDQPGSSDEKYTVFAGRL